MKERKEIENKYKANTSGLFESEQNFLEEIEKIEKEIQEIKRFEGNMLDNTEILYEAIH